MKFQIGKVYKLKLFFSKLTEGELVTILSLEYYKQDRPGYKFYKALSQYGPIELYIGDGSLSDINPEAVFEEIVCDLPI